MKELIVKFKADYGRNGNLDGLFICTQDQLDAIFGKDVYFGEVLGKHSNVTVDLQKDDFEIISDDQDFIAKLKKVFKITSTISGHNPIDYIYDNFEGGNYGKKDEKWLVRLFGESIRDSM